VWHRNAAGGVHGGILDGLTTGHRTPKTARAECRDRGHLPAGARIPGAHLPGGAPQVAQFRHLVLSARPADGVFQLGPARSLTSCRTSNRRRCLWRVGLTSETGRSELIDCLGHPCCRSYTPRSLAVGWIARGRDASGTDIYNETDRILSGDIPPRCACRYPAVGAVLGRVTRRNDHGAGGPTCRWGCLHPALLNRRASLPLD